MNNIFGLSSSTVSLNDLSSRLLSREHLFAASPPLVSYGYPVLGYFVGYKLIGFAIFKVSLDLKLEQTFKDSVFIHQPTPDSCMPKTDEEALICTENIKKIAQLDEYCICKGSEEDA